MRTSTVAKAASKPTSKSKPAKDSKKKPAVSIKKPAVSPKKPAKPAPAAKAPPPKPAPAPAKKPVPAPAPKTAATPAAAPDAAKKPNSSGPKGITIVSQKPMRKPKPKPKLQMPVSEPLLKPGGKWKPLIPSGPKAPPTQTGFGALEGEDGKPAVKAKLPKRELDKYRDILRRKRSELVGDIATMEEEALRQNSGSLSSLPQHMAEQGSDASEQSLSLDLAQVDRNLIREIDEALNRIDAGTYGICELTHKPISADRLAELPWARHSIEAARELERRSYRA
jgi:RNA polymerase-binding transcription factor DksA